MAQQPPQGYGPPPGYQHPQGYGPPPQPPKQGMGFGAKILIAVGAMTLLGIGTCATCAVVATGGAAKAVADAKAQRASGSDASPAAQAAAPVAAPADPVELKTLLSEYKDNEVRADAAYKGKRVRVTGKVGDIKKDILNHNYVTVGTGAMFEIPTVQCMLEESSAGAAMQLSKGAKVTVEGSVKGLMMNVLIDDCVIAN
jgi:tRNA_anti-like